MGGIVSYILASTVASVATEELELTWPIPRYSTKKNQIDFGTSWKSAPFSFKSDSSTNFFLNFYPKSENKPREGITLDEVRKWTSIYIYSNVSSKCKDIPLSEFPVREKNYHVELSILDANEKKCFTRTFHRNFSELRTGYGSTRFSLQSELEDPANNLLPDGTLTIHCRIKKLNDSLTVCLCPSNNHFTPLWPLLSWLITWANWANCCTNIRLHMSLFRINIWRFVYLFFEWWT